MSYLNIPILRDKNVKNGNEFYTKFLESTTFFGANFGSKVYRKDIVLVKGDKRRKLLLKEIQTFVKIYLLPKLYLFYSKIDYTFTSNIKDYYEYYNKSLDSFNYLSRFYLNPANPVVRRVNFDINKKMQLEKKNKNSNTGFYDVIIKNNEEVVGILKSLSTLLVALINKNKAIRKKYDTIVKLLDELKIIYDLLLPNNITSNANINNGNNDPIFQRRINNMIYKLDEKYIDGTILENAYIVKYNKIKAYSKKYEDFLKKYQSIMSILVSLDINIDNFNLDKTMDINNIKEALLAIYVKSHNTEIVYRDFLDNITLNIKKIEEINKLIELLKSMGNKKTDYNSTIAKIKFNEILFLQKIIIKERFLKDDGQKYGNTTVDKILSYEKSNFDNLIIKTPFSELLFYTLGYIINNIIRKHNFLIKPALVTNLLNINGNTITNNTTIVMLKNSIKELQKSLKEKEENIDEKIKNIEEEKTDLEKDELPIYISKRYENEIKDNEKKNTDLDAEKVRIDSDNRSLRKQKSDSEIQKDTFLRGKNPGINTPYNTIIQEIGQKIIDNETRLRAITTEKEDNKKQIKHFQLLNFKEDTNIELIKKKIKLQDELLTQYGELKKSNPFEKFQPQEFITFEESLKKFTKVILKESSKTGTVCPIVSYFTQNHLYYSLFFDSTSKNPKNPPNIDLNELLSLKIFFPKSKPLIRSNKQKEEKPDFNEDFFEKISEYIGSNSKCQTFLDFLGKANKNFKDIIAKLLRENSKEIKFDKLGNTKIDIDKNITSLLIIIDAIIADERNDYRSVGKNKTQIYSYTNFIIAYFAIYLIIINLTLKELIKPI